MRPAPPVPTCQLWRAVEGEQPQPGLMGEGDILFFLYRVAKGQPVGGNTVVEAEFDLTAARHIEISALALEHGDDLRRRVRFHRIVDAGERQVPAQQIVGLGDHIEIDDKARRLGMVFGKEAVDSFSHSLGHPEREAAEHDRVAGENPRTRLVRQVRRRALGSANANRSRADPPYRGAIGRFLMA